MTGIFDEGTYEEGKVVLDAGDRLVLFTDGITEAANATGAMPPPGRAVDG